MKYEVEYSAPPKLDKWGHFLPNQPIVHHRVFDTLEEAKAFALEISTKFRRYDVNVLDLNVYDDSRETSGTWCTFSYKDGKCIWENKMYI